jgi:hypothetical protein
MPLIFLEWAVNSLTSSKVWPFCFFYGRRSALGVQLNVKEMGREEGREAAYISIVDSQDAIDVSSPDSLAHGLGREHQHTAGQRLLTDQLRRIRILV